MIRTITLAVLLLLFPLIGLCQGSHVHLFRAEGIPNTHAVKMAHGAVLNLDPLAELSFDEARLKVRSSTMTSAQLLAALNSSGTVVYHIDNPTVRTSGLAPLSFPVRINSGDPLGDDQRYAAAKEAWIAANPEEYQRMMNPNGAAAPAMNKQH